MDQPYPSFQLAEFVSPDGLSGRNCGSELKAGMTFNRLRRTRFFGDIEYSQSEEVGASRPILLTLTRIEAYGRTLDELSPGMTALSELSGGGFDAICEELEKLPEREFLSIESVP